MSSPPPTDGRIVAIPLSAAKATATESTQIGQLAGGSPVAPIVFGGCLFAVSTAPATFSQWCGDQQVQSHAARRRRFRAPPPAGQRLGVGQRRRHRGGLGHQPGAAPRPRRGLGCDPGRIRRRVGREQHRRRGRRGHRGDQPRRPERRDRRVRRDRRGGSEPTSGRPRRRDPDPRRPPDRRRRARQRHRPERRRAARHRGRPAPAATPWSRSTPTDAACRSRPPPATPASSRSATRSPTGVARAPRQSSPSR